MTEHLADMSTV